MDITPRPDREQLFNFTTPYIKVAHSIFARQKDSEAGSLLGLSGRTVAVEKGFYIVKVLKEEYPTIQIQEHASTADALVAVSKKRADAYIGNRAVAIHLIQESLINNLSEYNTIKQTASVNAIGVRKDWPILRDILQKALNDITPHERAGILQLWVGGAKKKNNQLQLTLEERKWIEQHPTIRVASDPDFAPLNFRMKKASSQG